MAEVVSVAAKGGINPVRCALVDDASERLLTSEERRDVDKTRLSCGLRKVVEAADWRSGDG